MQSAATQVVLMFSILFPTKMWYSPDQALQIQIRPGGTPVTIAMVDFLGKPVEGDSDTEFSDEQTIDLRKYFPQLRADGTYILLAVPKGRPRNEFVGTPLVIDIRADPRRDAPPGPMVIKVDPLQYAVLHTNRGDITAAFYYDVAPNSISSFLRLAKEGFYDGLTFHRVIPDFIIQGGDPRGDGTGGPGYHVEAEFSDRKQLEGVLSMARQTDPIEAQGSLPRAEAANSAGSQFFICLDYERTKQLDGRYSAFGIVTDGLDVVKAIGKVQTDPKTDRPLEPQTIERVEVLPVTHDKNPYSTMLKLRTAEIAPTTNIDLEKALNADQPIR